MPADGIGFFGMRRKEQFSRQGWLPVSSYRLELRARIREHGLPRRCPPDRVMDPSTLVGMAKRSAV